MTTNELKKLVENGTLKEHHSSWHRGYVSRKGDGVVREYSGKFGKGYILESPSWKSTNYDLITYYIYVA
jgi:hypothetical protein